MLIYFPILLFYFTILFVIYNFNYFVFRTTRYKISILISNCCYIQEIFLTWQRNCNNDRFKDIVFFPKRKTQRSTQILLKPLNSSKSKFKAGAVYFVPRLLVNYCRLLDILFNFKFSAIFSGMALPLSLKNYYSIVQHNEDTFRPNQ